MPEKPMLTNLWMHPELTGEATALFPPTSAELLSEDARLVPSAITELRLLTGLVADLEPDNKSIPVLLRQYLRLGGKMLSFGIDNDFGGTLDCLVLVDIPQIPRRILDRYCGKDFQFPQT